MISVDSLLYNIDMELNKVATFENQEIPVENKIIALNKAQNSIILTKIGSNNQDRLGLDAFKKRYEDLQVLIEAPHLHKLELEKTSDKFWKWQADLTKLSPKYMFYIDAYALATKGACEDTPLYVNRDLAKHADVPTLFANTHTKPSFEYQETFSTISNNKLEVYSDGTFDFSDIFVSYIRYPKKIDKEGYIYLDGKESINQDSELPDYLETELINLAIKELAIATENIPAVNMIPSRTATQE